MRACRRVLDAICVVPNATARSALLARLSGTSAPTVVSFVNAHALNLAWTDPVIARNLAGSDTLLRDGIGVSLLMRVLGMPRGINMNGTDLIPLLLDSCRGRRVALCGTAEPYLTRAAEAVRLRGGDVVLTIDGFQDIAAYLPAAVAARAELVILGMGMPKQEEVASTLAHSLGRAALIVNGGAILDFWAGRFPRAPRWVQALKLEWLFRLVQEPRRLWRRYTVGGVIFVWRALVLRMGGRAGGTGSVR